MKEINRINAMFVDEVMEAWEAHTAGGSRKALAYAINEALFDRQDREILGADHPAFKPPCDGSKTRPYPDYNKPVNRTPPRRIKRSS